MIADFPGENGVKGALVSYQAGTDGSILAEVQAPRMIPLSLRSLRRPVSTGRTGPNVL
jgi:hypothetical protein